MLTAWKTPHCLDVILPKLHYGFYGFCSNQNSNRLFGKNRKKSDVNIPFTVNSRMFST